MDKLPVIAFEKKHCQWTNFNLQKKKKNAISHVSGALRFINLTVVHFPSES